MSGDGAVVKCKYVPEQRYPVATFTACPVEETLDGLELKFKSDGHQKWLHGENVNHARVIFDSQSSKSKSTETGDGFRYMIGIHSHEGSGKLSLHDLEAFKLKTKVKGAEIFQGENKDWAGRRDDLIEAFGAAKKKRQVASQKAGQVRDEAIVDLEMMQEHIREDEKEVKSQKEVGLAAMRNLLPKFNMEASKPGEIYGENAVLPIELDKQVKPLWIEEMISSDLEKSFSQRAELKKERVKTEQLYHVSAALLNDLVDRRPGSKKAIRLAAKRVQVCNWLVSLYRAAVWLQDAKKMSRVFGENEMPPQEIRDWMGKTFFNGNNVVKDKVRCHLFVWCVHSFNDLTFDFRPILDDMRLTDIQLKNTAQYVGCRQKLNAKEPDALKFQLAKLEEPEERNRKTKKRSRN